MADLVGYELLGNAVVTQAAKDYTMLLCKTKGKRNGEIIHLEYFFTGEGIKSYTKLDGRMLMNKLKEEAKKYNYSYEAIIKSRKLNDSDN